MNGRDNKVFVQKLIKRSYQFALKIIGLVDGFPKAGVFWTIGDQLFSIFNYD